jgi:hypothetical protein
MCVNDLITKVDRFLICRFLAAPWTDVMILKIFLTKISAIKLAFLTQNKAKF